MLYLSNLLHKNLNHAGKSYGKILDFAINDNQGPYISKVLIQQAKKKFTIPVDSVKINEDGVTLKKVEVVKLPYEDTDFFLGEDLLDKQVIDINGRRLVRVNDILIKENGELKIEGIDIGLSGILRRLGMNFLNLRTITLPWSLVEAFDYQTGNVQLKLTQSKLNTFHPAEIADMLEEAGTKERLGLVSALDAKQAARALEHADEETQTAILEQVPQSTLKNIIPKMRSSTLADIVDKLNPFTHTQIFTTLDSDKATRVRKLLVFEDDVAGGLMDFSFYKEQPDRTVGEIISSLAENDVHPETIIVTDSEGKIFGTIDMKNIVNVDTGTKLSELTKQHYYVYEDAPFPQILKLFAEYNLRVLPVVDQHKTVIGVISIETILDRIHEEEIEERDYAF